MKPSPSTLRDQLQQDSRSLAMPQGRRVGQPGNEAARVYIAQRLKDLAIPFFKGDSYRLPYHGTLMPSRKSHEFCNLVGVIPGSDRSLPPLLIGAHYDSVIDAPCADDNATSVALNLAIAKLVQGQPLQRDLILAFYDAEEPPYFLTHQMGSTRFFEDHCSNTDFTAAIITDLIGHDFCASDLIDLPALGKPLLAGTEKIVFVTGAETSGLFPAAIERLSPLHKGIRLFPTLNSYVGNMSDHHAFEQNSQPFLFFSCGQGRYYHHELDTLDWINFQKLEKLTRFIHELLQDIDQHAEFSSASPIDTTMFEIEMMRKAVGPVRFNLAMKALGMTPPSSRKDLDKLIGGLVNQTLR